MKPADEHNMHDAILALLDGGLSPDDATRVRGELDANPASAAELAAWNAMFDDLHAMGDAVTASAPEVALWDSVQARLDAEFAEDGESEPWTFDRLLDLAEGRLDQRAATELRGRIEGSEELRLAYAWVVAVRDELGDHGDAISNAAPSVDLLPAIMRAATTKKVEAELEDLFASLLEWRDGQLPLPDADRLRRLTDESETVRDANAWLAETAEHLEALGDGIADGVPDIDVTRAVMDAVHRISEPETIVSLGAERLRRRTLWRRAAGLATAAMVTVGIGGVWFSQDSSVVTPPISIPDVTPDGPPTELEQHRQDFDIKRRKLRPRKRFIGPTPVAPPTVLQPTRPPVLDADAVLEARKKAAQTGDWSEFLQLASLTREEVLELAEKEGVPATAIVGLADSLLPDEKETQLLTVVGMLPDSPYLQLELLESVAQQPPGESQTEEPLAFSQRLSELDPQNALPLYLEAKMHLQNGDPQSAIAALLEAQALEYASPYSLEAAAHRQSALIASGLPPETAELLAAFNAGNEEADALFDLAVDLLEYGSYYNEIRDFETALVIFEGVQLLGDQIEAGAVLSQEQLVALDIQSAAIDVLGQFYEAQGIVEALVPLTEQSLNIISDLDSLNVFFVQLNSMLGDMLDPAFWNDVAGVFLTEGDLAILDYLEDWGILVESP